MITAAYLLNMSSTTGLAADVLLIACNCALRDMLSLFSMCLIRVNFFNFSAILPQQLNSFVELLFGSSTDTGSHHSL